MMVPARDLIQPSLVQKNLKKIGKNTHKSTQEEINKKLKTSTKIKEKFFVKEKFCYSILFLFAFFAALQMGGGGLWCPRLIKPNFPNTNFTSKHSKHKLYVLNTKGKFRILLISLLFSHYSQQNQTILLQSHIPRH